MTDTSKNSDESVYSAKLTANSDYIIGLPARYAHIGGGTVLDNAKNLLFSGVPILAIKPAYPQYGSENKATDGLQLYHLDYDLGVNYYSAILKDIGVKSRLVNKSLFVCFINNTTFSESFNVNYSDSTIEGVMGGVGQMMREVSTIAGTSDLQKIGQQLGAQIKGVDPGLGKKFLGLIPGVMGWAGGGIEKGLNWISPGLGNAIMAGSSIDFPTIWKGSNYSPTYSITVRLHNDRPKDDESYNKNIVDPLASLLALNIPISDSKTTYRSPLLCTIVCPGLFRIEGGYISTIEIIKGGDDNVVSFRQRPSIIDIRITFNDLYNTVVGPFITDMKIKKEQIDPFKPTFTKYINQLYTQTDIVNIYSSKNPFEVKTNDVKTVQSGPASTSAGTEVLDLKRVNNSDHAITDELTGVTGEYKSEDIVALTKAEDNTNKSVITNEQQELARQQLDNAEANAQKAIDAISRGNADIAASALRDAGRDAEASKSYSNIDNSIDHLSSADAQLKSVTDKNISGDINTNLNNIKDSNNDEKEFKQNITDQMSEVKNKSTAAATDIEDRSFHGEFVSPVAQNDALEAAKSQLIQIQALKEQLNNQPASSNTLRDNAVKIGSENSKIKQSTPDLKD